LLVGDLPVFTLTQKEKKKTREETHDSFTYETSSDVPLEKGAPPIKV